MILYNFKGRPLLRHMHPSGARFATALASRAFHCPPEVTQISDPDCDHTFKHQEVTKQEMTTDENGNPKVITKTITITICTKCGFNF